MSDTLTSEERKELEKLRKVEKVHKLNSTLSLIGVIIHLILMVVIAVFMMANGFSAKASWITGILAPSVIWWLLSCPLLW